jgi:hypothetical protein
VRGIVRGAAKDDYRLSSLILGVVNSDTFRRQGPPSDANPKSSGAALTAAAKR